MERRQVPLFSPPRDAVPEGDDVGVGGTRDGDRLGALAAHAADWPVLATGNAEPGKPVTVINSTPIIALLERVSAEGESLAQRAPQSDLAHCTSSFVRELAAALKEARDIGVFVTIEALARITGRPPSTLTRICRKHGRAAGATKVEGAWTIHLPTFQNFLKRGGDNLEEVE